jgi:lysophospholipase L1-like esterase
MNQNKVFFAWIIFILSSVAFLSVFYFLLSVNTKLTLSYVIDDLIGDEPSTLMIGSSTIARFPFQQLNNCKNPKIRGFSNGLTNDAIRYLTWGSINKSKTAFIYVGENDIARGASVSKAFQDLEELVELLVENKTVKIGIFLIKNSPRRWEYHELFQQYNRMVKQKFTSRSDIVIVNLNLLEDPRFFINDGVHLSRLGYTKLISWVDQICEES